jgi:hypothetical protein
LDLAVGDTVTVYDGSSSLGTVLATMSGTTVTATALITADSQRIVMSTQNSMVVKFTSHRHSSRRGFLFAYQAGRIREIRIRDLPLF